MTHRHLVGKHLTIGLILAFLIAGGVWWLIIFRTGVGWFLLAWLIGITPVAFFYYGYDKWKAKIGGRRVPEAALHGLSFAGGSLGAYVGMRWFRHKTIKGQFRILFWMIVVLQIAVVALVLKWTM